MLGRLEAELHLNRAGVAHRRKRSFLKHPNLAQIDKNSGYYHCSPHF